MKRFALGSIVGGVVFFIWGMVYWMAFPIVNMTIDRLPEERLLMDTMKVTIKDAGFYMFPHDMTSEGRMDEKEFVKKWETGPSGILVVQPQGAPAMSGRQFLMSFLVGVASAKLVLFVLFFGRGRLGSPLMQSLYAAAMGVTVWFIKDIPYWNWWGFPGDYTLAQLPYWLVGFWLLGLVGARFVPKESI